LNESALAAGRVRSFLFEQLDIRGIWVQLDQSWRDMIAGRDYAQATIHLLGELAAVTVLITSSLKQQGRLTFQLRGSGAVDQLVMDCDEQLHLRGMAHEAEKVGALPLGELLGAGFLTLTLDSPDMRQPYQSQVQLEGASLAAAFEHYLAQSEQQPARLWLASDSVRVAGLFLQTMPQAMQRDPDGWNRLQALADTLRPEELLQLNSVELLSRVFSEEDVLVYDPRPVIWHCPEDWAKVSAMLRSIGREECEAILREVGEIHVHDDICNRDYRLDADDVVKLFSQ
jgi:molecular chaperone Hsp33